MTSEERERMNSLSVGIQEETDYHWHSGRNGLPQVRRDAERNERTHRPERTATI
jgi:hypothetical protein